MNIPGYDQWKTAEPDDPEESVRACEWLAFSDEVYDHIQDYVVCQYGDKPNDPMSSWTIEQIAGQAEKYLKRLGKNAREGQDCLDMIKLAHCAQIIWEKLEDSKCSNKKDVI